MSMKAASGRGNPKRPQAEPGDRFAAPRKRLSWPFAIFMAALTLALGLISFAVISNELKSAPAATAPAGVSGRPAPSGSAAAARAYAGGVPVVTEVMTDNKGAVTDEAGQYTDWIEIWNPTDKTINLAGFALSDKQRKPGKCVLPTFLLEPGKYVLVFADGGQSTKTELHASFRLDSSGTALILTDPGGNAAQSIDVPELKADRSYSLDAGPAAWSVSESCTPGFANTEEGRAAYLKTRKAEAPVLIDEAMAGNTMTITDGDGDYSDWVEIFNPSGKDVDLTGWGLSDSEKDPKRWVFPQTVIRPGGYLVVFTSGKDRAEAGKELHANFRLNEYKDAVLLSNFRGQVVSEVAVDDMKDDASWGLAPGSSDWQLFLQPTPGFPNDAEGWRQMQSVLYTDNASPVVISELASNNASEPKDQFGETPDWIELYNRSGKAVNLKGWGLTDKSDEPGRWQFPDIIINPGAYLTVFASGRNLKDAGAVSKRMLHTDFTLGGSGGVMALTDPKGGVADRCFLPSLPVGVSYGRAKDSLLYSFIADPTPGAANAPGYPGMAADPVFSLRAGLYEGAQKLELTSSDPEAQIYYTTDGSAPTKNSERYAGPIDLKPTGGMQGVAVRAIACRDGYLPSNAVCSTYLLDMKEFFGAGVRLPVVSIVTDEKNLFDPGTGIYINYSKDWERPAHVELIEADGKTGISQDAGIKIFGAVSRTQNLKGFALFARSKYGKGSFDYRLFPDLPYSEYESFVLRPSGNEANISRIRDVLITSLARTAPTALDVQVYRNALLFVNGEYWGVTQIRDKINNNWIAQRYDLDRDKIDLLEGNGAVKSGSGQDYKDLVNYVKNHDMSVQANYDYVASKMDIDSFIDWHTVEICTGNSDTGNVRFWKSHGPGGKWRWILYDFCWGFWETKIDRSDIALALDPRGSGAGGGHFVSTALINGLLKNKEFKDKFLTRLAYHISVTFAPDRVLPEVDKLSSEIAPYMDRDFRKWHYGTGETWQKHIEKLRTYCKQHPAKLKAQMKSYFHLSDAQMDKYFKQ